MRLYILAISFLLANIGASAQKEELKRKAKWFYGWRNVNNGIQVARVDAGGTMEALGLKANDIITEVDGISVASDKNRYGTILDSKRDGDSISMTVLRNGEPLTLKSIVVGLGKAISNSYDILYESTAFNEGRIRILIKKPRTSKPVPVVLFIPDFPCWPTDAFLYDNYARLADKWVENGLAVVYVEKSGLGDNENTPDCETTDFNTEVSNYEAGLRYLYNASFVDKENIFLYGHGIGGIVAAKIAAVNKIKGVIVYGTTFRKWSSVWLDRIRLHALWNNHDMVIEEKKLNEASNIFYQFFHQLIPAKSLYEYPANRQVMEDYLSYDAANQTILNRSASYWQQLDTINIPGLWSKANGYKLIMSGEKDYEQPFDLEEEMITETANSYKPVSASLISLRNIDHNLNTIELPVKELFRTKSRSSAFNTGIADLTCRWLRATIEKSAYIDPEIVIPRDTSLINLKKMGAVITKGKFSTQDKVRAVIGWANANLEWTATDYVNRSAKEVLCKKGGNCNEEKKVVVALFDELGIKTRTIREINIQPENSQREKQSEELIASRGNSYSVFGLRHNDHVWIEYWDQENKLWEPADPTTGLIGLNEWLKSRVGFSERPMNKILPTKDMLVPFFIAAVDDSNRIVETRSNYYLVKSFNDVYNKNLSRLPAWSGWRKLIEAAEPGATGALKGKVNLHDQNKLIKEIMDSYETLKTEYMTFIRSNH
ncbi:MAG: hypothetical protein JWN76_2804 [Chitinophagaceae bacterium]|nr:hypothetical protein [Chitinophagaceae bacterium]